MVILRHKQRPITSVSPAPGQGRFIVPSRPKFQLVNKFFTFVPGGGGSFATTDAPLVLDLAGDFKFSFVVRFDSEVGTLDSQAIFDQLNGAAGGIRFVRNSPTQVALRLNGSNTFMNIQLDIGKAYNMTIESNQTNQVVVTTEDPPQTESGSIVSQTLLANTLSFGHSTNGLLPMLGAIRNFEFFKSQATPVTYSWRMDEGEGPTFFETVSGEDATITPGQGFWTP